MTKKILLEFTKIKLIKVAKTKFKLHIKPYLNKNAIVSLILSAAAKVAKLKIVPKKSGAVKKAKKKTAAKPKLTLVKPEAKAVKPGSKKVTDIKTKSRTVKAKSAGKSSTGKITVIGTKSKSTGAKKVAKKTATKKAGSLQVEPTSAEPRSNISRLHRSRQRRHAAGSLQVEPTSAKPATVKVKKIPAEKIRPVATAEEQTQEAKFFVAPTQEHLQTDELPERYNDNRLILLVRDPYWIHAFWDINPETERQVKVNNGISDEYKSILRVYDVTDINFDGQNAAKYFDTEVDAMKGSWYVNLPEDGRSYCAEIGLKDRDGNFYMIARSNVVIVPRASVSNSRVEEEWMIADEEFWKVYTLSGGFKGASSSEELIALMQERLKGETSSGAVSSFGASEIMEERKPKDDFWFRLNCDLIVYGAAKQGAKVTLMGQPIELRPDGTFSTRLALPDGLQIINVTAVSENRRYEKTITPTVSRNTTSFEKEQEEN